MSEATVLFVSILCLVVGVAYLVACAAEPLIHAIAKLYV